MPRSADAAAVDALLASLDPDPYRSAWTPEAPAWDDVDQGGEGALLTPASEPVLIGWTGGAE